MMCLKNRKRSHIVLTVLWFLKEIDDYIVQAKERSYETMVNFGKQGLSIAATAAVTAAVKASVWACAIESSNSWL